MKHSGLLWLILHKAVYTGSKALRIGKPNGLCPRCRHSLEDLDHLFFYCPFNLKFIDLLHACFSSTHPSPFSLQEILLGLCKNLDPPLWHWVRSLLLFHIWKERNAYLFQGGEGGQYLAFKANLVTVSVQVGDLITDAAEDFDQAFKDTKALRWQVWKKRLLSLYSSKRLIMVQGIKDTLLPH